MAVRGPRRAPIRRDERISVELTRELHAGLLAQAEAQNVSISAVVRDAITHYQKTAPAAIPFRQTAAAS